MNAINNPNIESSNDQAISDCSVSNLCQNDTQNSLPIKQENQDMGDDFHIENHISPNCKVEDLQKQLSEYIFVAETIDEMYVKEVQKSDELQKRVDKAIRFLVEAELYQSEPNIDLAVKALKGEG